MGYRGKYRKRRSSRRWIIPLLGLCLALFGIVSFGSGAAAKYTMQTRSAPAQAEADTFYFTSNFLAEGDGGTYSQVCDSLNEAAIHIELYNYTDSLNVSEANITCTVQYRLSSQENYTPVGIYNLPGGTGHTEKITLNLSALNPTGTSATVYVLAETTAPYSKTLVGRFTVAETTQEASLSLSDTSGSNMAQVTVTTGSTGGGIKLTAPAGYIPDPTNFVDGGLTINGQTIEFAASPDSQYNFRFLKTSPNAVVSSGDFKLS